MVVPGGQSGTTYNRKYYKKVKRKDYEKRI